MVLLLFFSCAGHFLIILVPIFSPISFSVRVAHPTLMYIDMLSPLYFLLFYLHILFNVDLMRFVTFLLLHVKCPELKNVFCLQQSYCIFVHIAYDVFVYFMMLLLFLNVIKKLSSLETDLY